jgi:hypothetical protein
MTTPPNISVRPRRQLDHYKLHGRRARKIGAREVLPTAHNPSRLTESWFDEPSEAPADTTDDGGQTASATNRLDGYLKAWGGTALVALGMASTYGSDASKVGADIENARAGTQDVDAALNRLVRTQIQVAVMDGEDDFSGDFQQYTETSIWRTMNDERVCPDCASQEGLPEAEWEITMPAHCNCRCWPQRVPIAYQQLAGEQSVPGAAERSMVFRDPVTGEVAGSFVVTFDTWRGQALQGEVQ